MATRRQEISRFNISASAARRNMGLLEAEDASYVSSPTLFRGKEAREARDRRRTGRSKTEDEIKRQLGRIGRRAATLTRGLDNTEYKRFNKAMNAVRSALSEG